MFPPEDKFLCWMEVRCLISTFLHDKVYAGFHIKCLTPLTMYVTCNELVARVLEYNGEVQSSILVTTTSTSHLVSGKWLLVGWTSSWIELFIFLKFPFQKLPCSIFPWSIENAPFTKFPMSNWIFPLSIKEHVQNPHSFHIPFQALWTTGHEREFWEISPLGHKWKFHVKAIMLVKSYCNTYLQMDTHA